MKHLKQIFLASVGVATLVLTVLVAAGRISWRTISNWIKKCSKWLRYLIATIFTLVLIAFLTKVVYLFYEDAYGRDYFDVSISDNVSLRSFSDNRWRVYNNQIEEYTTEKINWLSKAPEGDSLAVYALPGKRGYINVNTGCVEIDAEQNDYCKAWVFSEGLAAVMKNDGKVGFINTHNEVVIPFQFDYSDECHMADFAYIFHNGYCAMTNAYGALGLIDKSGSWVIEPYYDEILVPHTSGYRLIVKDNKHGVIDSNCALVYPAEYDCINILNDGFVLTKGGRKWQVDFAGNIIRSFMYDNTYYLNYPIGYNESGEIQNAFADFVKYEIMNSYGIMNRFTGEPITPAIYSDINMLSKDLFEVQEYNSYDYLLLDTKGNVVSKEITLLQ